MSELPAGFDIGGVRCYPDPEGGAAFSYIPGEPCPERDATGRPTVSLWMIPSQPMLQLGTLWAVDEAGLTMLREGIYARNPELDKTSIRLSLAPVSVDRVSLLVGDSADNLQEIGSSPSSGFPPFQAIFSARLTGDQAAWVAGGLNGGRGHLEVSYHVSLPTSLLAEVTLAGDVSGDLATLTASATPQEALQRIKEALAAGRLTLTRGSATGVPEDFWLGVEQRAQEQAADHLLDMVKRLGVPSAEGQSAGALSDHVAMAYHGSILFERTTDVANWFASGGGSQQIHVFNQEHDQGP
jgi:hypothetical protein